MVARDNGKVNHMETHFDSMQPSSTEARQRVKDDLQTLMHDAEGLIKATAGDMSEKAQAARSKLKEALEKAKATYQSLEQKTVEMAKATDKCIRAHPYESIGVAFGLGVLLGVLIGRR